MPGSRVLAQGEAKTPEKALGSEQGMATALAKGPVRAGEKAQVLRQPPVPQALGRSTTVRAKAKGDAMLLAPRLPVRASVQGLAQEAGQALVQVRVQALARESGQALQLR